MHPFRAGQPPIRKRQIRGSPPQHANRTTGLIMASCQIRKQNSNKQAVKLPQWLCNTVLLQLRTIIIVALSEPDGQRNTVHVSLTCHIIFLAL